MIHFPTLVLRLLEHRLTVRMVRLLRRTVKAFTAESSPVVASDDGGGAIDREALAFLTQNPIMASRRMRFGVDELVGMIAVELARRGVPLSVTSQARWVWVGDATGSPELYLISPGRQS
jgi:hypothetical protein